MCRKFEVIKKPTDKNWTAWTVTHLLEKNSNARLNDSRKLRKTFFPFAIFAGNVKM